MLYTHNGSVFFSVRPFLAISSGAWPFFFPRFVAPDEFSTTAPGFFLHPLRGVNTPYFFTYTPPI